MRQHCRLSKKESIIVHSKRVVTLFILIFASVYSLERELKNCGVSCSGQKKKKKKAVMLRKMNKMFFFLASIFSLFITSRRLSRLSWRPGLSLVGVIRAIKLDRPQVEDYCLLDVVHHCQTVTVAKYHSGDWQQSKEEVGRKGGVKVFKTRITESYS